MSVNATNVSVSVSSNGGPWEEEDSEPGPVIVEAYSVVLSAAALVLTAALGGGGGLTVLLALFRSRQVRKYSYTLVLVFFFLCCGLSLLWSPMELAHLLTYHHSLLSPTLDFGVATFTLYVFLSCGLAVVLAAFCLESVLRLAQRFPAGLRAAWPLAVCVTMFLTSFLAAVLFLSASAGAVEEHDQASYLVVHHSASSARLAILTVLLVMVAAGGAGVVAIGGLAVGKGEARSSDSFLSTETNPPFLAQQPAVSSEGVDKVSLSPSCSSKTAEVAGKPVTLTTPAKESCPPRLADLPAPSHRAPNMLAVNMAQVLGRRRHTICQIGDSSTPPDPIAKAKQYNYVRKFSVDISALQAQLENPKLFKDTAPFASHQDLRQKQQQDEAGRTKSPKFNPQLQPLLTLPSTRPELGAGVQLPVPSLPPVITVSEEVKEDIAGETKEERAKEASMADSRPQYQPMLNKAELTNIPRLPVTQPVEEEDEDEGDGEAGAHEARDHDPGEEEEEDEDTSCKSNNRLTDRDQDFVRMTLLLTLTYFLCTFPLFLLEALRGRVTVHTYINISICARALSCVQTIIYPHIVLCMDTVVKQAVQRLQMQLSRICSASNSQCSGLGAAMAPENASSSTSQV